MSQDKRSTITFSIDKKTIDKLKEQDDKVGISNSKLVYCMLKKHLGEKLSPLEDFIIKETIGSDDKPVEGEINEV